MPRSALTFISTLSDDGLERSTDDLRCPAVSTPVETPHGREDPAGTTSLPVKRCNRCGTSRGEIQHETIVTERGGLRHGALFCQRCYFKTHPGPIVPELPPPPRPRRPRDPDWIEFRKRVIAALQRDGLCFYGGIDTDLFSGLCPICSEPLRIRFRGRTPAADFLCRGGCDERQVVAMLGKANR